jgi:putative nucleotidyltransferase with HDIG domain
VDGVLRPAVVRNRRQTVALRERSQELLASYRLLEQNSFEAIETLNATVEAKDPYTAGHSARVQRVAVALGERLALSSARLDTLRYGGLFHDIGKIGVPDAILLKPARLTPDEYQVMKRHSEDGALIVGKLARLRETVPLIRHHHEHWDGRGFPDGLAGEQIPLEASIVGLADAWDAMTTERPYARALTLAEALAQIREGRGTQFAPVLVDAFLGLVLERPESIGACRAVRAGRLSGLTHGSTSRSPGRMSVPSIWFRSWIFHTPSRGSPPYLATAIVQSVSAGRTT